MIVLEILGGIILLLVALVVVLTLAVIVITFIPAVLFAIFSTISLKYNMRSIRARWASAIVAVLGIAGTVGVFVAMLSLARGFKATLVASGTRDNALIVRAGSTTEMTGAVDLDTLHVIQDAPGVARGPNGPLVSGEVVVIAPFPLIATGTDANVQVRGVSAKALEVRPNIHMIEGRFLQPGLDDLVVGRNVAHTYVGLALGDTVKFGGGTWHVVGVFDAGGSAFDSEVWCDAHILNQIYHRPESIFQSITAHLTSADAFQQFKDSVMADPRLNVDVGREVDYYEKQSRVLTKLITVLGSIVAGVMAIGAVIGALNTMYSAVAERTREIATLRAIGFGASGVVASFLLEILCISLIGGVLGCAAVLPLNGYTTGSMNMQTFSHMAFAFRITPGLLGLGVVFALLMGYMGGLPPAIRAARQRVAAALRAL